MTDSEAKRLTLQAVRNARRLYRAADSAGEKVERWLDRQVKRKTFLRPDQSEKLYPLYEEYLSKVQALDRGVSDMNGVSIMVFGKGDRY